MSFLFGLFDPLLSEVVTLHSLMNAREAGDTSITHVTSQRKGDWNKRDIVNSHFRLEQPRGTITTILIISSKLIVQP